MFEILEIGLCNKYFQGSTIHIVISVFSVIITGYLLGSLNFGVIISKVFYHDDVRKHGSKGAGATNMLRTYGKFPAAMTFLGDGLKAAVAVLIGAVFLGMRTSAFEYNNIIYFGFAGTYIGGMASVIGHAFPVYYKFKGGKGVASTFFMVLFTSPLVGLICLVIFIIIVAGTKFISLGSIMAVLIYPLILNRMTGLGLHNLIAIFISLLIVYLHRENIIRLLNGKENKFSLKSRKKTTEEEKDNNL
ncbi:MAG: glycerol-3-phosphate 1-O-acyltransferase PlsY [Oscillospiraceae bacterium]|nr:glycerol-3-phosphate 1-O-acyltransferase PlsY [Oscillospiraceae bacterium]